MSMDEDEARKRVIAIIKESIGPAIGGYLCGEGYYWTRFTEKGQVREHRPARPSLIKDLASERLVALIMEAQGK